MAVAGTTAFVTRADEFLGTELVKVLTAHGHQVFGLAASVEAALRGTGFQFHYPTLEEGLREIVSTLRM